MESDRRQEADKGSAQAAKPPHFFKLILSQESRLRLPKKFVRDYGHKLPGTVLLEAPQGPIWPTRLTRSPNSEVWLEEGFQQFQEYYSIGFGYFLVFRYDGDFSFSVVIFDTSAMEIEYSSLPNQKAIHKTHSRAIEEDAKDDCLHGGANSNIEEKNKSKKSQADVIPPHDSKQQIKKDSGTCTGQHLRTPVPRSTIRKKDQFLAYQKARAFKSMNPFFMSFMQPSYVSGYYRLGFPTNFAKKYLYKPKDDREVMLHVPDGRKWMARYHIGSRFGTLYWRKFVLHNDLQVGDACVFELITETKSSLNVIIYRN